MSSFTLNISDITIPSDRQRQQVDSKYIDELSESIKCFGLINAVVVDESNTLISGYCRIKAHELLGRTEIEARRLSELDDWEKQAIEFEENVRRKNLEYNDQLLAELKLYEHYIKRYGPKSKLFGHTSTARPKWRVEDMAKLMGFSLGKMSERLQLARAIRDNPNLGQMKSITQAKHELERQQVTAARTVLAAVKIQEQKTHTPEQKSISMPAWPTYNVGTVKLINVNATDYIPTLADDSIGCLVTDPPWNVQYDETFGNDPTEGFDITKKVLTLLYPKLQDGSLCVMYCATKHLITGRVYELVKSCGYAIYDSIHIWYKPQTASSSQPYRELKYDYEPALVFSKGRGRDFNYPMYAVISHNLTGKRDHSAQKSPYVLEALVRNFSVEREIIIDPFMGSGQTMLACLASNRLGIGLEKVADTYSAAVITVDQFLPTGV